MLPLPAFQLHQPRTLPEAVELIHRLGPSARLVAGGTDLVPNLKQGLVDARALVSLQRVRDLGRVRRAGDTLQIGAMASLDAIASHPEVGEHAGARAPAAAAGGGPPHPRRGTLGGTVPKGGRGSTQVR